MTEAQASSEPASSLREEITAKGWWQGSVIPGSAFPKLHDGHDNIEWWLIASQTCDLHNSDFQKTPVFELVAASKIDHCDPSKIKGDSPRILHVEAQSSSGSVAFEISIQKRRWLPRELLAQFPKPNLNVRGGYRSDGSDWLDVFSGWLGRSYTRVALPDEFNDALRNARIEQVLKEKLIKQKNDLYGIYISIDPDAEEPWLGNIGEMPPPYLLGMMLVTKENADPIRLRDLLLERIFTEKITDPGNKEKKITRAELLKRHGVRIIEGSIDSKSIAEITLLEVKSYVRYTFVDYLSDSSMATGD